MTGGYAPAVPGQKLHIGCGPVVLDGWVNIDKSPSVLLSRLGWLRKALFRLGLLTPEQASGFPPGVVFADVSRRIPAEDGSVAYIYSSHMIEHLSRWQALEFVRECDRVLGPGGVLRLATPDLAQLVSDYGAGTSPFMADHPNRADAFCAEYAAYSDPPGSRVRKMIRKLAGGDSHQWLYDAESLSFLVKEGGFGEVELPGFREGRVPELDTVETRERSLFLEAVKAV